MLTQLEMKSFASMQNAKLVGNTVMGSFQQFPYSVTFKPGKKQDAAWILIPIWGKVSNRFVKQLNKSLPKGQASAMLRAGSNPALQITVAAPTESILQLVTAARYTVVQKLSEQGISAPQVCPVCGQGNCDCLAYYGGYRKAHRACVTADLQRKTRTIENNNKNGSFAGGFIGAVLGALVGLIPTVLLVIFANLISAWLFALIPVAAFFGYKLFGGKLEGKLPLIFVILASLLTLPVLELVQFYAAVVEYWGTALPLGDTVLLYLQTMTPADTAADLLQPLLFMALGLFISRGVINQNNGSLTMQADELAASIAPLESSGGKAFEMPAFESIVEKKEFDDHACYDESVSTAQLSHDEILRQYDNVDEVSRETFSE